MKLHLYLAATVSALALAAPAHAQDGESEERAERSSSIDTIIVTAQRREESVQNSSLSISVLDEDKVATITDAKDISALVPGVQISNGGSTLQTYVRGVGDFGSSALNQSAVSYNIDGVYVADTTSISTQFYDLARVEVLKGPQGTLYGRNASAGSVNLVYAPPEVGELGAEFLFEAGNYDLFRGSAAINVPVGDVGAIRASGNFITRDGYLSDGTNDDEQIAGRLQVLFEPTDNISFRLAGDIAERSGRGAGSVLIPRQPGNGKFTGGIDAENNAARLALNPAVYTPGAGLPPVGLTGLNEDTFIDIDQQNLSAELVWDLGAVEFTFIPAYRHSEGDVGSYISGAVFLNQEEIEQTSFEARLAHEADWGNIILGVYRLDLEQFTAARVFTASFITADQFADLGTSSIAGFGQATIDVTPSFRAILGMRYTNEDRNIDANDITNGVTFSSDVTFKKWTGRGGLEFDLTPDNMIYTTVSKGFKSGGFNIFAPTAAVTNAYDPETIYSYAVGARNEFFNNSLRFNIEAFYWDYQDAQQNALQFTPAGNLQFSTFNAASATLYGVDMDVVWQVSPFDTLTGSLAFLEAEFDEFILNPPFPTDPASNACALNNAVPPFSIDCSGFDLPRAPRWSGTASYEHVFVLPGGDLSFLASMDFASSRFLGINYVSNEKADGYVRANAEATYEFGDGRFAITGYIRNIFNEEIALAGNQGALTPNFIYAQVAPPRTYGLRFRGSF